MSATFQRSGGRPATGSAASFGSVAARLRVTLLIVLAAGATALALAASAAADPGVFTVERLEKKASIADLQDAARRARADMSGLKDRLRELSRQYGEARTRLDVVNHDLTRTRLELLRTQAMLETQRVIYGQRLAAMYKAGNTTVLDVLAGVSDFAELQSGLRLLRRIAESDRAAEAKLETLATAAARLESSLDRRRAEALVVESEIEQQRVQTASALEERRDVLERLTGQLERALAAGLPPALMRAPRGGHTPVTWAKALLKSLDMPLTSDNLAAILAWEMAEGGHWHNTAHYNPLNTTWRMPGATPMNSVGVKAYLSWAQGLAATVNTFHNGLYDGILAALRAGDDAQAVADAVAASPWGTGSFAVRL